MGLNKLDLLSISPRNYIFENNSNKTIFGGCLTLVLIIISLLISAYYLIYYITEKTYSIEYVFYEEYKNKEKLEQIREDERYNPFFDYNFDLLNLLDEGISLPDDFIIINSTDNQPVPRQINLRKRVTDINFIIAYKCNELDEDCNVPVNGLTFQGIYNGFVLDHQNESSPLYQVDMKHNMRMEEDILVNEPFIDIFYWKIIKYKQEAGFSKLWNNLKGIDDENQSIIGLTGYKADKEHYNFNNIDDKMIIERDGNHYRFLAQIALDIDIYHYDEYNRIKKSILNPLSSIFSLCLAVYNALSLFLIKFYSVNFDNYKIVEKILLNEANSKKAKDKNILTEPKLALYEKDNQRQLLPINDDEGKPYFEEENSKDNINKNDKKDERILPKFRFIDFLLNNIYLKCCKKNKRQEIISKCNELIKRYYSIDNILYNQLYIENLIKDYNWNNPELNNFEKNKLIIQLNNFISTYNDD